MSDADLKDLSQIMREAHNRNSVKGRLMYTLCLINLFNVEQSSKLNKGLRLTFINYAMDRISREIESDNMVRDAAIYGTTRI